MYKMNIKRMNDAARFLREVRECKGDVLLHADNTWYNLKSDKTAADVFGAASSGDVDLELKFTEPGDIVYFINYLVTAA